MTPLSNFFSKIKNRYQQNGHPYNPQPRYPDGDLRASQDDAMTEKNNNGNQVEGNSGILFEHGDTFRDHRLTTNEDVSIGQGEGPTDKKSI